MARRSKENAVDWDGVERAYRIGNKTNSQIAKEFGVSLSSIGRKATEKGWVQDKAKEVEAVTNSLLIQNAMGKSNPNATPTPLEIKAAAQHNASVVLEHREDIQRTRQLFRALLREVEVATDLEAQDLMRQLFDIVRGPEESEGESIENEKAGRARADKMRELLNRVLSRSGRIDDAKRLAEMLERLVKMEREAHGIGQGSESTDYEETLRRVSTLSDKLAPST